MILVKDETGYAIKLRDPSGAVLCRLPLEAGNMADSIIDAMMIGEALDSALEQGDVTIRKLRSGMQPIYVVNGHNGQTLAEAANQKKEGE